MHALCSNNLLLVALLAALASPILCDVRMASTPRSNFLVRQRGGKGSVKFVNKTAIFLEPSVFAYAGLRKQRQRNYDNFLRSNVDNEQDLRNFFTEPGRDHTPFRTWEGTPMDLSGRLKDFSGPQTGLNGYEAMTVRPGQEAIMPLRWNNPHASELEVNIWIAGNKAVVPVRAPACAGEGHQDAVFSFIIPTDFNTLDQKVPGFRGCNKLGDCTIQVYMHSVETRTYVSATPILIPGYTPSRNQVAADDWSKLQPAAQDPGTDMSTLKRDVCLSSADPAVHIRTSIPRHPRLVSDQFNHAYQNSDYSPFHGQQYEGISRNLQAACIVFMAVGNRGELGKSVLTNKQKKLLSTVRKEAFKLTRNYEAIANNFIKEIGDKEMQNTGTVAGVQPLAKCFRCAEVGATNPRRLQTTTYIPSFFIPKELRKKALESIAPKYQHVISKDGILGIYQTVLDDMSFRLSVLEDADLYYQPAVLKSTINTMPDATQFRKVDANGKKDKGQYAARKAYVALGRFDAKNPCPGGRLQNVTSPLIGDRCLNGKADTNRDNTEIQLRDAPVDAEDVETRGSSWFCPSGCEMTKNKRKPYCVESGHPAGTTVVCKIFKMLAKKKVTVRKTPIFPVQTRAIVEADDGDDNQIPPVGLAPLMLDPSMESNQPDAPCDDDADLPNYCPDQLDGAKPVPKPPGPEAEVEYVKTPVDMGVAVGVPFAIIGIAAAAAAGIVYIRKKRALHANFDVELAERHVGDNPRRRLSQPDHNSDAESTETA